MPKTSWDKSVKGKARRCYDKWIKRWKSRDYDVRVTAKEFYEIFFDQDKCGICGGDFNFTRKHSKSIRIKDAMHVLSTKVILPENLLICHFSCGCRRIAGKLSPR